MLDTERKTYLFSVRLWEESQAGGQAEWRDKLQLLPAGEAVYFQGLASLPAHLEALLVNAANLDGNPIVGTPSSELME